MIRFIFIINFGIFCTLVEQNHLFGVNLEHVGINQMPILLIVIAAWQPKNQRLSSQVVTSSKYYLVTSAPRGCQELESPSFEKQITGILFQGISDWLTDKCTVDNIVNYLTFAVDNIVRANQLSWRKRSGMEETGALSRHY